MYQEEHLREVFLNTIDWSAILKRPGHRMHQTMRVIKQVRHKVRICDFLNLPVRQTASQSNVVTKKEKFISSISASVRVASHTVVMPMTTQYPMTISELLDICSGIQNTASATMQSPLCLLRYTGRTGPKLIHELLAPHSRNLCVHRLLRVKNTGK